MIGTEKKTSGNNPQLGLHHIGWGIAVFFIISPPMLCYAASCGFGIILVPLVAIPMMLCLLTLPWTNPVSGLFIALVPFTILFLIYSFYHLIGEYDNSLGTNPYKSDLTGLLWTYTVYLLYHAISYILRILYLKYTNEPHVEEVQQHKET